MTGKASLKTKKMLGVCQLTLGNGVYINAHIIPAALTKLSSTGEKYVEAGIGAGIKKRANSWYDNELVTQAGEDILTAIDTTAIEVLRKHKLVWTGWGAEQELFPNDPFENQKPIRILRIDRAKGLQLFFLSLLWRSAASKRSEFKQIKITEAILEDLRQRVLNKDPGVFGDYPIHLFQITTRGIFHNRTPLLEKKAHPSEKLKDVYIPYVRFYFDGLIAHIHLPYSNGYDDEYLRTCLREEDTIVFLNDFEHSRTLTDIKEMVSTVSLEERNPPSQKNLIAVAVSSLSAQLK